MEIKKTVRTSDSNFKFSILIPTWNNLDYLKLVIKSIRKNSHFAHQIIIHINEGSDGTTEWVKAQSDIGYTHSKENIGICYALNTSRTLVKTDYILYMNDDMYVCPNWDLELDNEIKRIGHNNFFISSTMIEPHGNNPAVIIRDCGSNLQSFNEDKLLGEFEKLEKEDWNGATWPPNIIHKDIWDLVGGYSLEFSPGMYSDPDFSMKLWQAGVRLFKGVGKSRVYHFGKQSTKRLSNNKGAKIFLNKWSITSSTFMKHYLKRGSKFSGELSEPKLSNLLRMKNYIKNTLSYFS